MIKNILKKLFKKISYGIFFIIYGKIEKSIKCLNNHRIKVNSFNIEKNLKYNVYEILKARLYTDRIQDVAVIIDNKIIEGPSFQLRNTHDSKIYNAKINNNIVFSKGTPRKLRYLNGNVLSLLTGGGGNNNYWHWLFDVLPRISLCSKFISLKEIDYFLLPDHIKKYQIETLDLLKIEKSKRISSEKFRHIKVDKLILTDHPVVTSGDATKDIMVMPGWISLWLKKQFLIENSISAEVKTKKIYIDRSVNSQNKQEPRFIENENEVKEYLLKNGFTSIKLHETKFIEQVKLFNNAECIVGLHGGGFANLAFCKPGTKAIELRSLNSGTPIENLAKKNNLNYKSIIVKANKIERYNFPNQQGSIEVSMDSLIKVLKN